MTTDPKFPEHPEQDQPETRQVVEYWEGQFEEDQEGKP